MRILIILWLFFLAFYSVVVSLGIGVPGDQASGCREDQESLLLRLRNSLTFKPNVVSVRLVTWNQSLDCCSWGGVTCDSTGHVVGLDLSSELISGGLDSSSALFSLRHLRTLNLANNSFNSSPIPPAFGKLNNLISLNLSSAGFSGQIPIDILRLTKLVTIDFSILYFPGLPTLKLELPNLGMLVRNLTRLKELYLDGVNISATGEDWCRALSSSSSSSSSSSLSNLQVLSLSNCYLSGPLDSSLQKLQSLSTIRLDNNNFSAPVPDFLANFSNLTQLRLSSCGLHGTFPKKILLLTTLQVIDLSNNKFLQGSLPESLPRNASLRTLVLSGTNFSGELPNSIGNLKGLTRIDIRDCNFSGALPNSMADLTRLVYLDFSNNKFSGGIPSLSMSKGLARVDLSHNCFTGPISSFQWEGLGNLVVLDLRNNSLNGSLPKQLFSLPSLQKIQLSRNNLSGPWSEFSVASSSVLDTLDLSSNNLEGLIPQSVFELRRLNILDLSSNRFNGTVELSSFQKLGNLTTLSLSYNNLSINQAAGLPLGLLNLTTLKLASCRLGKFPDLRTQSRLSFLDLSANGIAGNIPNWIWKMGDGSLTYLNLSHNLLEYLQEPFSSLPPSIITLDLHSNQLNGSIPTPPLSSIYVDYSNNNFTSSIPDDIGIYISSLIFFSVSSNNMTGVIPRSICKASYLQVLDLSDNAFSGSIPSCLLHNEDLAVLDLGRNKFVGNIPGKLAGHKCSLQTLDLNKNLLNGSIPESLANCKELEVLNLGNNQINDTFPCWLKNITSLRVLVLRGNKFHGQIGCPNINSTWATLQIVDLAHNNFSGKLPEKCFSTWTAMMGGVNELQSKLKHLQYNILQLNSLLYYQDAVTVTLKGQEVELVKVLTLFTSIDLSCNNLVGEIPEAIGNFTMLYVLNLSRNGFTGQIPSSMGNLQQLESLDLSHNRLNGEIPTQLAKLTFLSVLDLSYNFLVGMIPTGTQLQTFSETSFERNAGLCGSPLTNNCSGPPPSQDKGVEDQEKLEWEFIITGLGFGVGAGIIVAPLIFWKKGTEWLDDNVERFVLLILPVVRLIFTNYGRVEAEEAFEIELTDVTGGYDDSDEEKREIEDGPLRVRFCVFCSRLEIGMKKPIHDPNCSCHGSPPILSPSYASSSSFSQT